MDDSVSVHGPWAKAWLWFTAGVTAWAFLVSSGVAALAAWLMPFDWKTAVPWMVTLLSFSGGWAVVQAGRSAVLWGRRRRNPSRLTLSADSGIHACVGMSFRGEPSVIDASGRILRLMDGSPNRSPHRFECRLSRGGSGAKSVEFHDGDWANIVIASKPKDGFKDGFVVHRGGTTHPIPDSGAMVELTFRATPSLGRNETVRVVNVKVWWASDLAHISLEPSP